MKIQLLIALRDSDYVEHLSRVLIEKKSDIFEVSACSSPEGLKEVLGRRRFDAALLDNDMLEGADLSKIQLALYMWDGVSVPGERWAGLPRIHKYQRISSISQEVVQRCAACGPKESFGTRQGKITAVWSPAGGSGKTTVALAYAARRAAAEKRTVYLNLEPFSAGEAFFKEPGKSISAVFEKLDGDTALMFQSIQTQDAGSGIIYFGAPRNYDDINVLTQEDVSLLLEGCAANADELVVDLGSGCSKQVRAVMTRADQVFMVADSGAVCRVKCEQFRTQHNVYAEISGKLTVIANRGARGVAAQGETCITLPKVDSDNPVIVYKTLSQYV